MKKTVNVLNGGNITTHCFAKCLAYVVRMISFSDARIKLEFIYKKISAKKLKFYSFFIKISRIYIQKISAKN